MSTKLLKGLVGATAAIASLLSATVAQAVAPGLSLSNDLWSYFNGFVQSERLELQGANTLLLDPNSLRWANGVDPAEVYFINEGAGFRNALYYSINGGSEQLIWGDIASPDSILPEANGPMELGQGFSLGQHSGDTRLSLFLSPNGESRRYGADPTSNPDGLQHVIARNLTVGGENWVLVGFEDLFGDLQATSGLNQNSDRDFNDVVVAIRGVVGRPDPSTSVPEPGTMMALFGVGAFGLLNRRSKAN